MKIIFLCSALLAANAALCADLSGDWQVSSSVNGNPVTIACTLVQEGDMLVGTCRPQGDSFEASVLSGTVRDANAQWGYDVVFNGNLGHVGYEAELLADGTLKGTMYLAGNPTAFTATRR